MRVARASVVTAVLSGAAICAGPLVGVSSATPGVVSFTPANHAVITTEAAKPTIVKATFNEALNSPTSPVTPSRMSVTQNGGNFACTAGLDPDGKTLTCTPFTGTKFTDGHYVVSFTASPSVTTGDTTPLVSTFDFTIDTTPPQLNTTTPVAGSRVMPPSSVVATYKENLNLTPGVSTLSVADSFGNLISGASTATNPTASTGAVTWIPDSPLTSGVYTATANVTDVHGLTSTNSWQFTVDDQPPAPPTVLAPTWVNIANQTHVPITGTADNSSTGGATKVRVSVSDGSTTLNLPDAPVANDGSWSVASSANLTSLADHLLTITASAVDQAGNVSSGSQTTSTKDTVRPAAPTVTFPDAGGVVNAANLTLHVAGVTDPGVGVSVVAADTHSHTTTPVTTTSAADTGNYDAAVDTTPLNDDTLTVTATATDAAGNTNTGSNTILKDGTPSNAPVITTFDPINFANQGSPHTVAGTAPNGNTVNVWLTDANGVPTTKITNIAVSNGAWTTTVPASTVGNLPEGTVIAHATTTDSSNNESSEGTKTSVKDTIVPDAPAYTTPTWINNASKAAVPLSGTAEPFTTVHLVATDSGAGSSSWDVPVQGDGTWSTTRDLSGFAEGAVSFSATVVDAAGNVSTPPTVHSSAKDTVAPGKPAAPGLAGPDNGIVTASGSGTTADSVLVMLTSDGGSGQASAPVTVTGGAYSTPVDVSSLADGTLTGVVTETDPAGNTSVPSSATTLVKDTTAPFSLVSTVPADGAAVQNAPVLSATFNEQIDLAQSTVTLRDAPGGPSLGHTTPTLSADKKTISVSPTSNPLGETNGYQVTFAVKDLSDAESLSSTVSFAVDRTAPSPAPTISSVANSLGQIAIGNVSGVVVSGTAAEPGGIVTVALTDGTLTRTATAPVAGDSTWTATVDATDLGQGPISATATQTDAAGNESAASTPASATKDTVAPAAPQSLAWSGNVTHAAPTVTFTGTAEPGSTVSVSVDDTNPATVPVAATTTAAGGGSWSLPLQLSSLSDGTLTATAWATDGFGNVGSPATADGTKDAVGPTVTLTAPAAGFSLGSVTAKWRAFDLGSGLAAAPYDVRWARAAHGKALGRYQRLATSIAARSITRTLLGGTTACFEVRAHDVFGNVSGWTAPRCRTVALDDKALTALSSGWTRVSNSRLFHGSAFTTTHHGATLTLPTTQLNRAGIVATHCATCGSIAVYLDGVRIQVIDLHSGATHRQVVTTLPAFSLRRAELVIKVISTGKTVQIDGIGTSAH